MQRPSPSEPGYEKSRSSADATAEGAGESGEIVRAEIHWYEATGIGKREFKIKRIL